MTTQDQAADSTALVRQGAAPIGFVPPPATLVQRAGRLYPTKDEWVSIMDSAKVMWDSGVAKAMQFTNEAAIITVALKGWELGVGLMASLEGIHIIEGKPRPNGAFLEFLGARVGGRVDWVKDGRDGTAECIAFRPGKKPVRGIFTTENAKQAELNAKNTYRKYPADMLCKRALSRATWKQYSDLYFGHVPTYNEIVDDEMGISDDAEVVETDGAPVGAESESVPANGAKPRSTRKAPAGATSAAAPPSSTAPSDPPTTVATPEVSTASAPVADAAVAPATAPADATPSAGAPFAYAAPPDAVLPFDKGPFKDKKLSDLNEAQFRQMIPGYRIALANPALPEERKTTHREWLPRIEAWAKYRGIDIPQS